MKDIIVKIKDKINIDHVIMLVCLLVLAIHFYSMAGGASDMDEEYYFYVSAAISRGGLIYADKLTFYPPVLFYIGAMFFRIFSSLYHALMANRILMTTLSLLGFYLIFDIFKRLKLSLFIIPATIFIVYSMHLNLTAIKFRPDNLLYFVMVLQGYLLYRLSHGEKAQDIKVLSMILLGVLSFHISQKALFIEPFLLAAFFVFYFDLIKRFISRYKAIVIPTVLLAALYVIFSPSYHRFIYQCYMYIPVFLAGDLYESFTLKSKLDFLLRYIGHNAALWLAGLASFCIIPFHVRKDRMYLAPLALLAGTLVLLLASLKAPAPYLQYQSYLIWATLFAMPFLINICFRLFPQRGLFIFVVICLMAISGHFTYGHYWWPEKSIRTFASEIDKVRWAIGRDGLASLGGASIDIPTALPFIVHRPGRIAGFNDIRSILAERSIKYVFIDQREDIKWKLPMEDEYFIFTNYQKCHGLPMMIASKWFYCETGKNEISIEIGGNYKIILLSGPKNKVTIDGQPLLNIKHLALKRGRHTLQADGPAAVLMEYDSKGATSESLYNLNLANYDLFQINRSFSGQFELLGMLKYEKQGKMFFRLFWEALSDVHDELMAFHHFCDAGGNYLTGVNIDPADGWYDIRYVKNIAWYDIRMLKKGAVISYEFYIDKNDRIRSVDIGWYYKQDWSKRLGYDGTTFYKLQL